MLVLILGKTGSCRVPDGVSEAEEEPAGCFYQLPFLSGAAEWGSAVLGFGGVMPPTTGCRQLPGCSWGPETRPAGVWRAAGMGLELGFSHHRSSALSQTSGQGLLSPVCPQGSLQSLCQGDRGAGLAHPAAHQSQLTMSTRRDCVCGDVPGCWERPRLLPAPVTHKHSALSLLREQPAPLGGCWPCRWVPSPTGNGCALALSPCCSLCDQEPIWCVLGAVTGAGLIPQGVVGWTLGPCCPVSCHWHKDQSIQRWVLWMQIHFSPAGQLHTTPLRTAVAVVGCAQGWLLGL